MNFSYETPELKNFTFGSFAAGITALPERDKGEQIQWTDEGD